MKKSIYSKIVILIFILSFITKCIYVIKTPYNENQHDVEPSGNGLSYILMIAKEGKLPDTTVNQYYHPPLHHVMAALFINIYNIFDDDYERQFEALQFLTLAYSMGIVYFSYKLFEELHLPRILKILGLIGVAFNPTLLILSGSLNNDVLCLMLVTASLYLMVRWYRNVNGINTTLLALTTGGAVMTKTSGGLVAIPIGLVFIYKLIKDIKKGKKVNKGLLTFKKYFWLFSYFGLVSLSIGLWFNVRNLIKFDQPILYVLDPHNEELYVGNYTIIERFLSIKWDDFLLLYCNPWNNYNIPVYLLKCSLYGEFKFNTEWLSVYMGTLMLNLLYLVIFINCVIYSFIYIKKNKRNLLWKVVFLSLIVVNTFSYITMNVKLPYGCTMDFRYLCYIIPYMVLFVLFGTYDQMRYSKEKGNRCLLISYTVITLLMLTSNIAILTA